MEIQENKKTNLKIINKTRENVLVDALDYQIPVTQRDQIPRYSAKGTKKMEICNR